MWWKWLILSIITIGIYLFWVDRVSTAGSGSTPPGLGRRGPLPDRERKASDHTGGAGGALGRQLAVAGPRALSRSLGTRRHLAGDLLGLAPACLAADLVCGGL